MLASSTTYTAANGDQLFTSFSGIAIPPVSGIVTFSGAFETSGTLAY